MPSLSGDASPRSPREASVLDEASKGKGMGLAGEYGTVEELLQRRASGAELEGALESLRDNGLSNTVLSNEEILLEIEEMSLDGTLGDVLPHRLAREIEDEVMKTRDARMGRNCSMQSWSLFTGAGDLSSVESMCTNCGIIAALVLTMTFGTQVSLTEEDYVNYRKYVSLWEPECMDIWLKDCGGENRSKFFQWENDTYNAYKECQRSAAGDWYDIEPQAGCCHIGVRCANNKVLLMKIYIMYSTLLSSGLLALVVLHASWLYTSLYASGVNRRRYHECAVLVATLRWDIAALQVAFFVSIISALCSFAGVYTLKTTNQGMAMTIWYISFLFVIPAPLIYLRLQCKVLTVNKLIRPLRQPGGRKRSRSSEKK